jgi:hypothetical protein
VVEEGVGAGLLLEPQHRVPEKLVRPLTIVLKVESSELVSTSAVSGRKPVKPSAVRVD